MICQAENNVEFKFIMENICFRQYRFHIANPLVSLLCRSDEPGRYAGESIAIRKITHARKVKGDKLDEKIYICGKSGDFSQ